MPTRKISDRERWTRWAREASDDELDEALEILRIEQSVRGAKKPAKKATNKKTAARPAQDTFADGSPNPTRE